MKQIVMVIIASISFSGTYAQQSIGMGTNNPHSAAALEISATNQGLLPPRVTKEKRLSIANPPKGLMLFDNNTASFWYFTDGGWKEFQSSSFNKDSSFSFGKILSNLPNHNMQAGNNRANIVTDTSGYIFDSGGPTGPYSANENKQLDVSCFGIAGEETIGVRITMMNGSMENEHDTLMIKDAAGVVVNFFTGPVIPQTFFVNGAMFSVVCKTDAAINQAGFQLRFDFVYKENNSQQSLSEMSGLHFLPSKFAVRGGFDASNWKQADSIGLFSFAYGRGNKATNEYSFSLGENNVASGAYSFAFGKGSMASSFNSFAFGNTAKALGNNATAIGTAAKALGIAAVSMGFNNTASEDYSITMGQGNIASERAAVALGAFNEASGTYSFAAGNVNMAAGTSSFAMGGGSVADGAYSVALGLGSIARPYASMVAGRYNFTDINYNLTSWVATDPLFSIGNGASPLERSNAFTILKNGNTGINVPTPSAALHIKGTAASFDAHLKLETTGAGTDYMNMLYDGNTKFRNSAAGDEYQFRNSANAITHRLFDNGNLTIAGTLTETSDARLKKDITPLQNSLQKIASLAGYHYHWLNMEKDKNLQTGVLAQEVEQQMPELVRTDEGGVKSVNYSGLIPYLVEAVKELKAENEQLKKEIETLKKCIRP